MKKPVKILVAVLIALVLGTAIGIGSAVYAYDSVASVRSITNGPWQTNLTYGSEEAGPYIRAATAAHGLLALKQSETIYYSAYTDDNGRPLSSEFDYQIEGKMPDARWWSITVYGSDDFLIANQVNRYSCNANNVTCDPGGKFTVYISKTQKPGLWVPLGDQKKFFMTLRLYNPGQTVRNSPGTVELPHIAREVSK
jgi:hypothetical protein